MRTSDHPSKPQLDYFVVLDVDEIDDGLLDKVNAEIISDTLVTSSEMPRHFNWDEIENNFTELSEPELVYLNWDKAKPVLTEVDHALFKAFEQFDIEMIRQKIKEGAHLNVCQSEDSILSRLIIEWNNYLLYPQHRHGKEISLEHVKDIMILLLNEGAHPDLHEPATCTALIETVLNQQPELAEILLEYGADASISVFEDSGLGAEPDAWNYASIDGFCIDVELGAREVYYTMVRHRSTPALTQQQEDQDRRDAVLPDAERSWWKA